MSFLKSEGVWYIRLESALLTVFGDAVLTKEEDTVTLSKVGLSSEPRLVMGLTLRTAPGLIVLLLTEEFVFMNGYCYFIEIS